jgi:CubicO group peptidase (beta-lactamase class C family)
MITVGLLCVAASTTPIAESTHHTEARDLPAEIARAIGPVVAALSERYNCTIAVGVKTAAFNLSVARGDSDRTSGRKATTADRFVWGSVTKVTTGTGILRLANEGKLALSDPIAMHVDPFLAKCRQADPALNFSSVQDLFGPRVHEVTVRDLLSMRSGIPDFDTANAGGPHPTDPLRATLYAAPRHFWGPLELIGLPWVARGSLIANSTPGQCDMAKYGDCYSSTNFMLLGFILAHHAGAESWQSFDQRSILEEVLPEFEALAFARSGAPSDYTPVHGYDVTRYNNNTKAVDVAGVDGVFGGWTASDVVAPVGDIAALAYDVYGPDHKLLTAADVAAMYESCDPTDYGLATFNLSFVTGLPATGRAGESPYSQGVAFGHLGATYGFQSVVAFFPAFNMSIAVATNIERDDQEQPSAALCGVFNTVRALILGVPVPVCSFSMVDYKGTCTCTSGGV